MHITVLSHTASCSAHTFIDSEFARGICLELSSLRPDLRRFSIPAIVLGIHSEVVGVNHIKSRSQIQSLELAASCSLHDTLEQTVLAVGCLRYKGCYKMWPLTRDC